MEASSFLSRPAEPQVFVDPSGRRAVVVRRALHAAALAFAAWMAALVLGTTGFSGLPSPVRLVHRVVRTAVPAVGRPVREREPVAPRRVRES
jgi:hypothetical protein